MQASSSLRDPFNRQVRQAFLVVRYLYEVLEYSIVEQTLSVGVSSRALLVLGTPVFT